MHWKREDWFGKDTGICTSNYTEALGGSVWDICSRADTYEVCLPVIFIILNLTMELRELAFQISEQFVVLGNSMNIRTAVIVGGMDMMAQALELGNRPHIVIATPGRIVDHLKSGSGEWDLSRVKFLVGLYAFLTIVKRFTR